jgi:hypothetical protein
MKGTGFSPYINVLKTAWALASEGRFFQRFAFPSAAKAVEQKPFSMDGLKAVPFNARSFWTSSSRRLQYARLRVTRILLSASGSVPG